MDVAATCQEGETGHVFDHAYLQGIRDGVRGELLGLEPTSPPPPAATKERVPLPGWRDRPYFLERCIQVGLSGPQISLLSLQTPQPLQSHQQVYEAIESAGLKKLFKKPIIERRRIGPHNKLIIEDFMRTVGQAYSLGMEVTEISRDETPHPKARMRPDLGYRLAWPGTRGRLFFDERQVSKLQFTRWWEKLRAPNAN